MEIPIDDVFQAGHLVQLPLKLVCEVFLLAESLGDVAFLMRGRLQLREHHIEALHETDLFSLQILKLIS